MRSVAALMNSYLTENEGVQSDHYLGIRALPISITLMVRPPNRK